MAHRLQHGKAARPVGQVASGGVRRYAQTRRATGRDAALDRGLRAPPRCTINRESKSRNNSIYRRMKDGEQVSEHRANGEGWRAELIKVEKAIRGHHRCYRGGPVSAIDESSVWKSSSVRRPTCCHTAGCTVPSRRARHTPERIRRVSEEKFSDWWGRSTTPRIKLRQQKQSVA